MTNARSLEAFAPKTQFALEIFGLARGDEAGGAKEKENVGGDEG